MGRKEGTSVSGDHWWVEATGDFDVRVCPVCGWPLWVIFPTSYKVKTVRIIIGGIRVSDLEMEIGEFTPQICFFCGYEG